jgi:hypothetical protein
LPSRFNATGSRLQTVSLTSPVLSLRNAQATLSWDGRDLKVPRFQVQVPQLARQQSAPLTGHFSLVRNELRGQVLASGLDAARLQRLADRVLPGQLSTQSGLSGVVFARADFAGSLRQPRASVQARLYRGTVSISGRTVPVDTARAHFTFATNATASQTRNTPTLTVRELALWSRGGRLVATGTLGSAPVEYSNGRVTPLALDMDVQLNNFRVRDLLALSPSGRAVKHRPRWRSQRRFSLDGNTHRTANWWARGTAVGASQRSRY